MKMRRIGYFLVAALMATVLWAPASETVLRADRDNVLRANNRTRNNGANNFLYIAHAPVVRAIVSFDLSGITGTVQQAVFRFRQRTTTETTPDITVAPMVYSEKNAVWKEGVGRGGLNGQNSRIGESCWAFSAFQSVPWENAAGKSLTGAGDAGLWEAPVATFKKVSWLEGQWVDIELPAALLEACRQREKGGLTLGLWGTDGSGYYFINSNNSAWPPELVLQLQDKK